MCSILEARAKSDQRFSSTRLVPQPSDVKREKVQSTPFSNQTPSLPPAQKVAKPQPMPPPSKHVGRSPSDLKQRTILVPHHSIFFFDSSDSDSVQTFVRSLVSCPTFKGETAENSGCSTHYNGRVDFNSRGRSATRTCGGATDAQDD